MRATRWIAALWPGLLQAWVLGCWRGLALATAFAVALNLAVITTLVWPRWPASAPSGLIGSITWVLVLGLWSWGMIQIRRDWARLAPERPANPQIDDWFCKAQHAYLRGHWTEAEALVKNILQQRPSDVETRLLRASIERRTRRFNAARQTLDELKDEAAAAKWWLEIAGELRQIKESEAEAMAPPDIAAKAA